MRFGSNLRFQCYFDWAPHCLDYSGEYLRVSGRPDSADNSFLPGLKQCHSLHADTSSQQDLFLQKLLDEAHRVSGFVQLNLAKLRSGLALLRNDISKAQRERGSGNHSSHPLTVHAVVSFYLAWHLSALQRRVSDFVRLNEDGFRKAIRKFVARSGAVHNAEQADELQRRLVDVLFGGLHLGRRVRVQLAAAEGSLLPLRRELSQVLADAGTLASGRSFPTSLLGMTPLHIACLTGDTAAVVSLLRAPAAALTLRSPHSLTGLRPLDVAAQGGRLQVVHTIMQHLQGSSDPLGPESILRAVGDDGRSPLQLAAEGGHLKSLQSMLDTLAAIVSAQASAGHEAAASSDEKTPPNSSSTSSSNSLPLWNSLRGIVFAEHETQKTTGAGNGDDSPASTGEGGEGGVASASRDTAQDVAWCVAHTAAAAGHVGVLNAILAFMRVADEAAGRPSPVPEDNSCVSSLLELRVGPHRNSPLHMAAHRGHADCVREVFDWGATVVSLNCHNESPLHLAVLGGHLDALQALLTHRDVQQCLHSQAPYSESRAFIHSTPSQYKLLPVLAVNNGFVPGLQALLAAGADPQEQDYRGWSALSRALYRGQTAATRACEAACLALGRDIRMGPPAKEAKPGKRVPGGIGNVAAPRDAWCIRVSLGGWHIGSTPPQPAVSLHMPEVPVGDALRLQLQWADPVGVLHAVPSTTPRAGAAVPPPLSTADEHVMSTSTEAPPLAPPPAAEPPSPPRGRSTTVDYDGSVDDLRIADIVALRAVLDVFHPPTPTPSSGEQDTPSARGTVRDGGTTGTQRSPEFELIPHSAAVYPMPPLSDEGHGGGAHSRVARVHVDIPQPTPVPGQWLAASAVDMSRRQNEMDCSHIFAVHRSGRKLPRGALTVLVSSASGRRLAWGSIAASAMWRSEFATSAPEHMCLPDVSRTEGQVMVTLFRADDTSAPCGTACVRFTAAPPTEGSLCASDVAGVRRRLDSPAAGKAHLVGHRGAGADSTKAPVGEGVAATRRTHVAENSLLSFTTAAANGASWVEFDVQLSKDGVPVIHHDFNVKVPGTSITVPITELTAKQLAEITGGGARDAAAAAAERSASFSSVDSGKGTLSQRMRHQLAALGVDAGDHFQASRVREGLHDSALTLKDCFKRVPAHTGFNIEVKYPDPAELRAGGVRVVNRAAYVHAILQVVSNCARDRRVYFSSFDPDICWLLAREQCQYAVFLLTEAGTGMCPDPRRNSLRAAVQFAVAHGLAGIVSECDSIVRSPRIVTAVLEAGLQLFTYGKRNNDEAAVQLQVDAGVQGIIVDHVAHIARAMAAESSV